MSESRWTVRNDASEHRDTTWVVLFMGHHVEARFRLQTDALEYIARKIATSKGERTLTVVK